MNTTTFGKTHLDVTPLGFGAAPVGILETEQQQVATILHTLLDRGVNLIDTAANYRGSERAIGEAISDRRDEYILVSKCGHALEGLDGEPWSARLIEQTIDQSLRRLKTDHLDVMLLHSCDLDTLKKGEALGALVKAREAGKIRFAGYSGDNEAAAHAATLDDVAVLETSVSICDQANIDAVLPAAREHNVGVIAKRPIANAAWKDLAEQPGFYSTYAATYTERLAKMNIRPADLGFDDTPAGWIELALRFTLSQPGVHTAIIGTTSPAHAESNIAMTERGPLPDEAVSKLRSAFTEAESAAGEKWAGQT